MPQLGMVDYSKSKLSQAVNKAAGDTVIGKKVKNEGKDEKAREKRSNIFYAVEQLVSAARKLYVDEEASFGRVVGDLAQAMGRLSEREKDLLAAVDADSKSARKDNEPPKIST